MPFSAAQEQAPALDGPNVILQDPLLDKMVGSWRVSGTIRSRIVEQTVEARWDIYGGRFSETLGYGVRSGDQIEFLFEYPDGPFRTTFRWLPEKTQWQWRMRTKNSRGQWVEFANLTLTREPPAH